MKRRQVYRACAGLLLWIVLAVPPVRHALESSITLHMLVQIPLLGLAGWHVAGIVPRRVDDAIGAWNAHGISGLVLASLTGLVWMLPRMLDAALDIPLGELAKFLSVPLLIGAPLALSWPRMGFVVRGVFLLEVTATAFRMGWVYLVSHVQLCSNYPVTQQQLAGKVLLAIGCVISLLLGWQLLLGHIRVDPPRQ